MKNLWEQDRYLTEKTAIFNDTIIEYDMRSANLSLAKEFKLLPEEMIRKLEALPKKDRVVSVGMYKRENKGYNELEKAAFCEARRMFFEENNLNDSDIIAIKRDAIFVNRRLFNTKLTKNIEFRPKNEYVSFINIKPLEIYYSTGKPLDVKGMNADVYMEYHHEYFGNIISKMFQTYELTANPCDVLKYLKHTADRYKWRDLQVECYREFSPRSKYLYIDGQCYDIIVDPNMIDIRYNFEILTRLVSIIL